ncbi:hypothetical protein H0X48_05420 [Candidatus Dependentiae bacterium]|nr:hypothetical protein [Candidatus Dependentiae bacterium]
MLGELQTQNHEVKYVYFTYNIYPSADGYWHCNHRCIEIKSKSEFLATKLEQAKLDIHFPKLPQAKKNSTTTQAFTGNSNSNGSTQP